MGTKNLARLYVGVCKADKIGQNGGQPSTLQTIDICVNHLFENTGTVEGLTKSGLKQRLSLD